MSDIQDIQEKKMYLIDDYDKIHFEFKMILEEDKIHFWIKEDKIFAPYTFEESFTYDQFVEHHKIFKACDDLNEILGHLKKLYDKNRIKLMAVGPTNERILIFNISYIAIEEEKTPDFTLELKMTENKDEDLLKLYEIQKDQIAALKKIKKLLMEEQLSKEVPFYKAIMEEIDKCESNID